MTPLGDNHIQLNNQEETFYCQFCNTSFKHKRSRDRHLKLHFNDRRYKCPLCESAFSRSDHLKIHMKTHDQGKPFQCPTCNRGYITAAALTAHMQGHKAQNQLAKKLKHFAKYQANCIPGLIPIDLIKSIMACTQQIQTPSSSTNNNIPNTLINNNLTNGSLSLNHNLPNSSSFLSSNSILPTLPNSQQLLTDNLLNGGQSIRPFLNSSTNSLDNFQFNNAMNINLNNQLNINLIQPINNELISKSPTLNSQQQTLITTNNKRSINCDTDNQNFKRLRTSSLSEKDENSSSSFNSINELSSVNCFVNGTNDLEDEEEVDVTSYEEERSNSVNSLISNSLSSSANSSNETSNNHQKIDPTIITPTINKTNSSTVIKKQSTNDNKQKKYSCRFCNSTFEYRRSCDRHEKSIHSPDRRYKCPECPNRYSRSDHLKSHLRTHERQRKNGKIRRRTLQTFVANNQLNDKLIINQNVENQKIQSSIERTDQIKLMCNKKDDQLNSANKLEIKIENKINQNDESIKCTSPNQITKISKQSNGFSNYNIESLLAENEKLKTNKQANLNEQPNYQNLINSDLIKQMNQIKNGNELYNDYFYSYYYNIYMLNNLNAINRQFNN